MLSDVLIRLLKIIYKNNWQKFITCINLSEKHKKVLNESFRVMDNIYELYPDQRPEFEYLLLVSLRNEINDENIWYLLGNLSEIEKNIWELISKANQMSLDLIAEKLQINKNIIQTNMKIFLENRVVLVSDNGDVVNYCTIQSQLKSTIPGNKK